MYFKEEQAHKKSGQSGRLLSEPGASAPRAEFTQEFANSFILFRGRILTAVVAGFALNMVSSPVKGIDALARLYGRLTDGGYFHHAGNGELTSAALLDAAFDQVIHRIPSLR